MTAVALEASDTRCANGGSEIFQHDPVTNTEESQGVLCNGATGATGATGPQGETGATGATGAQGLQGPQGEQGPQGVPGIPGAQGPKGNTGATGATGAQGAAGPQGPMGFPGEPGKSISAVALAADDARCAAGGFEVFQHNPVTNTDESQGVLCNGVAGAQGPAGATGLQGPQGETGPQGLQGPQGETGPQGTMGPEGPQGPIGPMGARGPQGPTGAQGNSVQATALAPTDTRCVGNGGFEVFEHDSITGQEVSQGVICNGAVGPQGPAGAQGPQGVAGPTGPQGPQGDLGPVGATGPVGPGGPAGPAGPQGSSGPQGPKGDQGVAGIPGPPGSGAGPLRLLAANDEFVGYYLNGSNWQWTPTSFSLLRNSAVYMIDAWTGHMYVPWTVFYYTTKTCTGTRYVGESFAPQELFTDRDPNQQTPTTTLFQLTAGTTSNITVQAEGYNGSCINNFAPFDASLHLAEVATLVTKDVAPPVRVQSP